VTTQDPARQRALVVPDKAERVYRFHENTLKALKELVQAAGLTHPNEISAFHIVRRAADHEVRLLANVLPYVQPGSLVAPARGEGAFPHNVFGFYWPIASADSFAPQRPTDGAPVPKAQVSSWGLLA
jgi:hypothetical protein